MRYVTRSIRVILALIPGDEGTDVAEGFIDWASLTEVANAYRSDMRSIYRWSGVCSLEVTCGLVHGKQLKVLPSPARRPMATKGPHDVLRTAITEYVDSSQPLSAAGDRRVAEVIEWAVESAAPLRELATLCMRDPDAVYGPRCGFDEWLSTALGPNAEATGLRVGGLFDMTFSRPLAVILQVTEHELEQAWQASRNTTALNQQGGLFDLVKSVYVLSIMFRGRYHDLAARELGLQVLHHPVRAPALPAMLDIPDKSAVYSITNSERYMAQLLWASGFTERKHEARIGLWAENVRLARMAIQIESIDVPQRSSEDRALETAVDAARRIGVRTHAKVLNECVELVLAIGTGTLSSFVINGWTDMYVTLGTYFIGRHENVGDRVMRSTFERRRRLKRLAEMPGRITVQFDRPFS